MFVRYRSFPLLALLFATAAPLVFQASSAYAQGLKARVVAYSRDEIIPINAKLRFTTLIVLPQDEKILDVATGDKSYWIINTIQNYCFLHPAKAGIASDLNLITDKGHVYSFTLQEISDEKNVQPDLKVFVDSKGDPASPQGSLLTAVDPDPRFVPASEVRQYQVQAQLAEQEARAAEHQAQAAEGKFRSQYPLQLNFNYKFKRNRGPFDVSAIFDDGHFTYIHAHGSSTPALYAISGGKPSLVQFQVQNGVYVVARVLDRGYLQLGDDRLKFEREKTSE